MTTEMAVYTGQALFRASTDAAALCKAIVTATARKIQGRSYVQVEGWQAIATAHGCIASAGEVRRITDDGGSGYMAIGRVTRMDTGAEIATAEGFVGDDEKTWANRPVYARRAMAQTRAISRACRSAFAHVVVMMNAGLETTPAEEVPVDGFEHNEHSAVFESMHKPVESALFDGYLERTSIAIANAATQAELKAIHDDAMEVCVMANDRDTARAVKKLCAARKQELMSTQA
jgi:hypothetical protein